MPTNASEVIFGTDGNDILDGLGGDDTIYGLFGDDLIHAGSGNDVVYGHSGNDTVYGNSGDDQLFSDLGIDRLYGGGGNDTLMFSGAGLGATGVASGGDGDDLISIRESHGNRIYGGEGTDRLSVFWTEDWHGAVTADFSLATPTLTSSSGNSLRFTGFEQFSLVTGNSNDSIIGSDQDDVFNVREGDDFVFAGAGDDFVSYGTSGAHTIDGGIGEDRLYVQPANSALYFIIDGLTGEVDDGNLSDITGFEHYIAMGSSQADIVAFGVGNDAFYGAHGNDTVFGGSGDDRLLGQRNDDLIFGGDGRDGLRGNAGADDLYGGGGRDYLNGGSGSDTLTGGAGNDRFVFKQFDGGIDLVTDFATGEDRILLLASLLGTDPLPLGQIDPSMLQFGIATGPQAQFVLRYDSSSDKSLLQWDSNGEKVGGLGPVEIQFSGNVTLLASDIYFI